MREVGVGKAVSRARIGVRERKERSNAESGRKPRNDRNEKRKTHPRIVQTREDGVPGRDSRILGAVSSVK